MTKLVIYPLLSTRSKRAIRRKKKKWGHPYYYRPKDILIQRLADDLKWTKAMVREQLEQEREFLLKHSDYF